MYEVTITDYQTKQVIYYAKPVDEITAYTIIENTYDWYARIDLRDVATNELLDVDEFTNYDFCDFTNIYDYE